MGKPDSSDMTRYKGHDFMSQKKIHGVTAVMLLGVLLLLCFYTLGQPVLADSFESATALTSAEMFNKNFWLPAGQAGSTPFYPAILYWSQLAGYHLFGPAAFGARFATAIAAVLVVAALYGTAAKTLGKRTGLQASLITASSLLFVLTGRLATGDMLAALFLLLNMILCWHAVEAVMLNRKGADLLLWLGCASAGLAMLSGGFFIVLLSVLTGFFYLLTIGRISLFFRKQWLLPGSILLVVIAFTPWLMLIVRDSIGAVPAFTTFMDQQITTIADQMPDYGSKIVFGLIMLLCGMLPWCCYLGIAVTTSSLFGKEQPAQRFVRLFVILSITVVLVAPVTQHGLGGIIVAAVPGAALLLAQLFERIDVQYSKRWSLAGWVTVAIFALLTLLSFSLSFILNKLLHVFGEAGQLIPALAGKVDLGYMNYAAAMVLACLTYVLYRGVKKRKVYAVYNGLTLASCGLACLIMLLVQPVYDRVVMRPVSNLAVEGARYTPEDGALLLYNIGERPSAEFYSERKTLVKNEDDHRELQRLFDENVIQAGISTDYFLDRLGDFGVELEELGQENGYVLFKVK